MKLKTIHFSLMWIFLRLNRELFVCNVSICFLQTLILTNLQISVMILAKSVPCMKMNLRILLMHAVNSVHLRCQKYIGRERCVSEENSFFNDVDI